MTNTTTQAALPPLPKAGPICYASVVDVETYAQFLKCGPHLPGVRDVALWSTDQMRAYATQALASLTAERDELQAQVEALRADAAETSLALEDLIAVGCGRLQHDFVSLCPDHMTGHESRDSDCMACKALTRAQTLIDDARKEGD